jgi:DNA processing protein
MERLSHFPGLTEAERRRLAAVDWESYEQATAHGVQLVTWDRQPERLAQTELFPAIFVDGDPSCLTRPAVAIVGTRNASTYGKACAMKFAEAFARAGVTVVSGGALGIDGAAHRGALAVGGPTVAVLAAGIDNVYPPSHGGLFTQIRANGALVSQFGVGVRPTDYKFLGRNGLIAALSDAVLVIQAPVRSGALSTVNQAAELGREVFVVPAAIDHADFRGSFNLIRDGATLVYHPDHVLEAIGVDPRPEPADVVEPEGDAARILAVLSEVTVAAERVVELTGLSASEVLAELTMLELDGLVIRDHGGYARRP